MSRILRTGIRIRIEVKSKEIKNKTKNLIRLQHVMIYTIYYCLIEKITSSQLVCLLYSIGGPSVSLDLY